jgi:hypothetical protein
MTKLDSTAASSLRPWTLWSDKPPKKSGLYWLAGHFPDSIEPENPIVYKLDDAEISGNYPIKVVHGYAPENLIWCGPLTMPQLGPSKST